MTDLATAVTVVDACGAAHVPVLLVSDPGTGKSSLVRSLAAAEGLMCQTVLGSHYEPAEVAGYPVLSEDGRYVKEPPSWARQLASAGAGVLFLDELTTCPAAVQAPMLTVVLERMVGDLRLPDGVRVVAGANPADRAAGGVDLEPPMANRFCHVTFDPSTDEWLSGMAAGWSTNPASRAVVANEERKARALGAVTGFISKRPTLLHVYPRDASSTGGPWPSRRTWSMLAEVLACVDADDVAAVNALIFGLVGEAAGSEFVTWLANADLPDPQAVMDDPEGAFDWAEASPDRVWAVLAAVTSHAASKGTAVAWRAAWGPLVVSAERGQPDVAGAAARALGRARPAKAAVPAAARRFAPMLQAAGLALGPERGSESGSAA